MSDLSAIRGLLDRVSAQVTQLVSEGAIGGATMSAVQRQVERVDSVASAAAGEKDLAALGSRIDELGRRVEKLETADTGHDQRIRDLEGAASAGKQSLSMLIKVVMGVGGALASAALGLAIYLLQAKGCIEP